MKTSVFESPLNIVTRDCGIPEAGRKDILIKLEGTGVYASDLLEDIDNSNEMLMSLMKAVITY
jgi:hypothetical protein